MHKVASRLLKAMLNFIFIRHSDEECRRGCLNGGLPLQRCRFGGRVKFRAGSAFSALWIRGTRTMTLQAWRTLLNFWLTSCLRRNGKSQFEPEGRSFARFAVYP